MSQVEGQNDNAGTILRLTDTLLNPSFQTWLCEDEYITENQKILTRVFHLFSANHYIILEGPSHYKKSLLVLTGEITIYNLYLVTDLVNCFGLTFLVKTENSINPWLIFKPQ